MRLVVLALAAVVALPAVALAQRAAAPAMSPSAIPQPNVAPTVIVGHFALAQLMEKRCPALRVDSAFADRIAKRVGITEADVAPGGRYWGVIKEKNERFQTRLAALRAQGRTDAAVAAEDCRSAFHVYGPNGNVMPGLMVRR